MVICNLKICTFENCINFAFVALCCKKYFYLEIKNGDTSSSKLGDRKTTGNFFGLNFVLHYVAKKCVIQRKNYLEKKLLKNQMTKKLLKNYLEKKLLKNQMKKKVLKNYLEKKLSVTSHLFNFVLHHVAKIISIWKKKLYLKNAAFYICILSYQLQTSYD